MNDILGTYTDTGMEWPKTDVLGAGFSIPATTVGVGANNFVVIPPGFNQWDLIADVKAALATPKAKSKKEVE